MVLNKEVIFASLKGGLIVSCQPEPPLSTAEFVGAMAQAVVRAGAVGIRANGPENVTAIRRLVNVPVIGINKQRTGHPIFITPTWEAAEEVIKAGAEIVALDGNPGPRPSGITLKELIERVHASGALVMADISTLEEGLASAKAGADIVASTLSGYTPYSPKLDGPDLQLVEQLVKETGLPVIAEGRYYSAEDVKAAFARGVLAVVVGRAITEPQLLTKNFIKGTPRGMS